jgi:hypothetical protein
MDASFNRLGRDYFILHWNEVEQKYDAPEPMDLGICYKVELSKDGAGDEVMETYSLEHIEWTGECEIGGPDCDC